MATYGQGSKDSENELLSSLTAVTHATLGDGRSIRPK